MLLRRTFPESRKAKRVLNTFLTTPDVCQRTDYEQDAAVTASEHQSTLPPRPSYHKTSSSFILFMIYTTLASLSMKIAAAAATPKLWIAWIGIDIA